MKIGFYIINKKRIKLKHGLRLEPNAFKNWGSFQDQPYTVGRSMLPSVPMDRTLPGELPTGTSPNPIICLNFCGFGDA